MTSVREIGLRRHLQALRRTVLSVLVMAWVSSPLSAQHEGNILDCLPDPAALQDWTPSDSARVFRGEELFLLIDGGAPLFLEYGFKQVVHAQYGRKAGNTITVEIYEMNDDPAAFGIHSFRNAAPAELLQLGDEAARGEYYVSFRKGPYSVTVTGDDLAPETSQGLLLVAHAVASRMTATGQKPGLVKACESVLPHCGRSIFIRGNLALLNHYTFDTRDIFGIREGVIMPCDSSHLILLHYPGGDSALTWFTRAADALARNTKYTGVSREDALLRCIDRDGNAIRMVVHDTCILISLGKDDTGLAQTALKIAAALARSQKPGLE